jgi:hypothetical protein
MVMTNNILHVDIRGHIEPNKMMMVIIKITVMLMMMAMMMIMMLVVMRMTYSTVDTIDHS